MENKKRYLTQQVWIKENHRLHLYFQTMCENAKNLYNVTNFYIRQVYTALKSDTKLHPLQQEVMDTIMYNIDKMNETQQIAFDKKVMREQAKPIEKRKVVKLNVFSVPTKEQPFVNYNFLDALFKQIKQVDYRSLPIQSSQSIMRIVLQNWKSFFALNENYKAQPHKYTGKPSIPKYSKENAKDIYFTNQDCVIQDDKYLKFPKTKIRLNIGKLGFNQEKLKQVRVLPRFGHYVVELVFEMGETPPIQHEPKRVMGVDLGINNLATVTTNTGMKPVLFRGKHIKSINQYYNKQKAHYMSILRHGKKDKQGQYTSKRLQKLSIKRHLKLKDLFHKVSYQIVNLALQKKVDTIIIGSNKHWKQDCNMGKQNNQSFCSIPHSLFIKMIEYKANKMDIQVIKTEESYTSKASFLDLDELPTYQEGMKYTFSGTRIKRGLYRSANGTLINADVNGSANIIRKVVPHAFAEGIEGLFVSTPLTLSVW